jgi:hypothetical protein
MEERDKGYYPEGPYPTPWHFGVGSRFGPIIPLAPTKYNPCTP